MSDPPSSAPGRSLSWSALRDFLIVAESGSLSEAARRLGVSQPTLTRRMAALERELEAELFRRSSQGLELTEAGEAVLAPARRMDEEAQALELAVTGTDRALAGTVRITATEGIAVEWLTPAIATFRETQPHIEIEVMVRNTSLNVLRREADIAIRLGRPQHMDLVTRRVGEMVLGLYASRDYLARAGTPADTDALSRHQGVAFDEREVYTGAGTWLERSLGGARVVFRANTLAAQRSAIRAGIGIGGQSCFIADRDPELVRVLPEVEIRLEIWLITHPGLKRSARIRAVYDFLAEGLLAARPLFAGET